MCQSSHHNSTSVEAEEFLGSDPSRLLYPQAARRKLARTIRRLVGVGQTAPAKSTRRDGTLAVTLTDSERQVRPHDDFRMLLSNPALDFADGLPTRTEPTTAVGTPAPVQR